MRERDREREQHEREERIELVRRQVARRMMNAGIASGLKTVFIHIKQDDGTTVHEVRYPHSLVIMPSQRLEDRVVFDDALGDGWRVQNKAWSDSHPYDLKEDAIVFGEYEF